MFSQLYKLQTITADTYLLFILFILLCVLVLWKYLRTYYYISKVPGPPGYPIIGNILLLRNILKADVYFKLFRENDGFFKFWLGPLPIIFVSDPTILQVIYTSPVFLDKGKIFNLLTSDLFRNSLIIEKVEKWKRNRKICNYAFTQTILNSFLPIFNDVNASLIEQLQKEVGKTGQFDVFPYFRRAALDSICGTAMGIQLNSLKETKSPFAHAMDSVIATTVERFCSPLLYPPLTFKLTNLGKKHYEALDKAWRITSQVFNAKVHTVNNNTSNNSIKEKYENLNQSIEKNPLKKPFLEFLLDMVQLYPELTAQQIQEETNLMIMAGYETSAVTLSYMLLVFGARKDIQEKVYHEVFGIFGNSQRPVELEDLPKMKYMELVIKETLRLYPAIAHTVRENAEDINLGGYHIPAGTTFFLSISSTHRNPKYWEKPLEFIPERFLENRHPYAFVPFSGGIRNCIGGKYAMMFMKIQLANILRKFEIHTTLKLDQLHFELDLAVKVLEGHLISLSERKNDS